MNEVITKQVSRLEQIILFLVLICAGSFIVKLILDGTIEYMEDIYPILASTVVETNTIANATSVDTGPWSWSRPIYVHCFTIAWFLHWFVKLVNRIPSGVYSLSKTIISHIHDATFVAVLRNLYLYGPSLNGYLFWAGRQNPDICAQLGKAGAEHWSRSDDNRRECDNMVESGVQAFILIIQVIILIVLLVNYALCCRRRYFNYQKNKFIKEV